MTRVHAFWAGLALTAAMAFVLLLPTAIEYGLIAGITLNAID